MPGDFDNDGDVDLADFNVFQVCFGQSAAGNCQCVDIDINGVIDLDDYEAFADVFSGILPDCNGNGIADWLDIVIGTSRDCDGNDVPDECDIALGLLPDCNTNGLDDTCEVADGISTDCNRNDTPDDCDIDEGLLADCNKNDRADLCEVLFGEVPDCNTNGVPDRCEIDAGTAADCNTNGVLDGCELKSGDATDCNTNGVLDECEWVDCNANGVLDECDIGSVTRLLAYWPLDGTGEDASGAGYDLDVTAAYAPDGLFGQALNLLHDVNLYAVRPVDDPVFNFADRDFALQVWVNWTDLSGEQVLIEKWQGASGPGWTLTKVGSNQIYFQGYLAGSATIDLRTTGLSLSTGVWHHVLVTCNDGACTMYVDADEAATGAATGPIGDPAYPQPLLIGKRNAADGRNFAVNGQIDEGAIWNGALASHWVPFLYNAGIGRPVPDMAATDCDENGVLDECEWSDCNNNAVPDACDILAGTSDDCDSNTVPDECEWADCNGNEILDACDIAAGTSDDCNGNGVLDECEWSDCNGNEILDACDIADCAGDPACGDCDGNGVPDGCEYVVDDCDGNGLADECEIAEGLAEDCQPNGVPDACDIASGTSQDTDGDGRPDECVVRWTGLGDGTTWWDAANWDPHVPTADDPVIIDLPGTYTINLSGSASAWSVHTLAPGATLKLTGKWLEPCSLTVQHGFTNEGTIQLSTDHYTSQRATLTVNEGVLENTGTIVTTGNVINVLAASLVNHGTLTTSKCDITPPGAGFITNYGDIHVTEYTQFILNDDTFTNSNGGTTTLSDGDLACNYGTVTNEGTFTIPVGRRLAVTNETLNQVAGPGSTFTCLGSLAFYGSTANFETDLVVGEELIMQGSTFNGPGQLTAAGTMVFPSGTVNAPFVNQGTLTSAGMGEAMIASPEGTFANAPTGQIKVSGGLSYDWARVLRVEHGFTNDGTIEINGTFGGHAILQINDGVLENTGAIMLTGTGGGTGSASLQASLANEGTVTASVCSVAPPNAGTISNSGTIDVTGATWFLLTDDVFTNSNGLIEIAPEVSLSVSEGDFDFPSGELIINGTLSRTVNGLPRYIDLGTNATLRGTGGTILYGLDTAGTVAPGQAESPNQVGQITFGETQYLTGYGQDATGVLEIDLAGTAAGQYDKLVVAGSVFLYGPTLRLNRLDSYVPSAGDSFVIIWFGDNHYGTGFSSVELLPAYDPAWEGLTATVNYGRPVIVNITTNGS